MKKITLLTGLTKSSPSEKLNKSIALRGNIYTHPDLQNMPVAETVLQGLETDLQTAITTANNGAIGTAAVMHAKADKLYRTLKFITSFVEDVVNDMGATDGEALALSLGFLVKKPPVKTIKDFEALPTAIAGEIKLRCKSQGSSTYFWYISADDGATWQEHGITMVASITKGGFATNLNYKFKVKVLNKEGMQPLSEEVALTLHV